MSCSRQLESKATLQRFYISTLFDSSTFSYFPLGIIPSTELRRMVIQNLDKLTVDKAIKCQLRRRLSALSGALLNLLQMMLRKNCDLLGTIPQCHPLKHSTWPQLDVYSQTLLSVEYDSPDLQMFSLRPTVLQILQNVCDSHGPGGKRPLSCLSNICLPEQNDLSGFLTKISSLMTFFTESNISLWNSQMIH